nr:MAG TPA: hypothetical protein [Caudoviricetes sp.]
MYALTARIINFLCCHKPVILVVKHLQITPLFCIFGRC